MTDPHAASSDVFVACLCAQWCRTCDAYREVFDVLLQQFAGRIAGTWVDIEDQAEAMGPLDVENFPTLLIVCNSQPCFWGPVLPHAATAARLVQSALDGNLTPLRDPELWALGQRLRALEC